MTETKNNFERLPSKKGQWEIPTPVVRALTIITFSYQLLSSCLDPVDALGWKMAVAAFALGSTMVVAGWWHPERPRRPVVVIGLLLQVGSNLAIRWWYH